MKDPKRLTPEQIASYLDRVGQVMDAVRALQEHATRLVHSGVKVPGYVAAFTTPHRKWLDEDKTAVKLQKMGLPKRDCYDIRVLSPAKAEDALRQRKLLPSKRKAEFYEDPLAPLIDYGEGNPTIKKATEA